MSEILKGRIAYSNRGPKGDKGDKGDPGEKGDNDVVVCDLYNELVPDESWMIYYDKYLELVNAAQARSGKVLLVKYSSELYLVSGVNYKDDDTKSTIKLTRLNNGKLKSNIATIELVADPSWPLLDGKRIAQIAHGSQDLQRQLKAGANINIDTTDRTEPVISSKIPEPPATGKYSLKVIDGTYIWEQE